MTWIAMLQQTYDNSPQLQGKLDSGEDENRIPLLLVGQSTQNAHVEVLLNDQAEMASARVITDKPSQVTLIPCTEASIGRTGIAVFPHPLHDKLQYVAKQYKAYGGTQREGFSKYFTQLDEWCTSFHKHEKVCIVRDYLQKGILISDLIKHGIMLAEEGKLVKTPTDEQKKQYPLLRLVKDQTEVFVRFAVHLPNDPDDALWLDNTVIESFNKWQDSKQKQLGLCYVTGKQKRLSRSHPAKIRHTGDKAKLISSSNDCAFTYKGRFRVDSEAVGVSYEVSQKAHNMLKWLVSRHGYRNDSQVFVAWGTQLQPLPGLGDDTQVLFGIPDASAPEEKQQQLRSEYALRLRNTMAGYGNKIADSDNIVVMGLDSATTGRMSIIFYRTLSGSDFLARIEAWHRDCSWYHTYKFIDKKCVPFIGAPSPRDITTAAYGKGAADKLIKASVERLMHCIVDSKPIPPDIRQGLVRRASNPSAMEKWEWEKTVSIACAVIRKHLIDRKEEIISMTPDLKEKDRNILFGQLIAYAHYIEDYVQYRTENTHRQTNAERLMHAMTLRPAKTWSQLYLKLQSYLRQLQIPGLKARWNAEMQEIINRLGKEGFTNEPLEEQYLLGFSSQMMEFQANRAKNKEEATENDEI
ncbi:MAG: type I-C CRISPR-associated protein Cas8c/Csd1 [Christensenellales bacterium]|jgi:CRISPR-associated protein Csd1